MEIFLAVAFIALILGLWAFAMYRFRLGRWTIAVTIVLLVVLFVRFFAPEDEETDGESTVQSSLVA